ncbi:hypothetical protein [Bosea sp. BH3]|uniref:hypothetical protein n=1 Tax=Bosea sp. BH3 TaxID=2871701 RepID=UPI0021CB6113|nr:hypothetical protein [Bosea sp. BH3]MCU4180904.1 hypothetical protein [Bosea sp. BH3]
MLRTVLLTAGLILMPAAAMAQGQPDDLRSVLSSQSGLVPLLKKHAVAERPGPFVYTAPVSFGKVLSQQQVVQGEDDLAGDGVGSVSDGTVLPAPPARRIIHIIE